MAKVTVVICTRRRPVQLKRCLQAVSCLDPAPTQVLVVDNSKGDIETEKIAREFGARYTIEPKPGLNHARNRAKAECKTEAVLFLDDEDLPPRDWLGTTPAARVKKKISGSTTKIVRIQRSTGRA